MRASIFEACLEGPRTLHCFAVFLLFRGGEGMEGGRWSLDVHFVHRKAWNGVNGWWPGDEKPTHDDYVATRYEMYEVSLASDECVFSSHVSN